MDQITAIVVAVISSGILTTIINRWFTLSDRKKDANNGLNSALRLVMKDRIRYLAARYIDQGWVYADERADLIDMHRCYHDTLKGNGWLDDIMEQVKNLPIKGATHQQ